jgi:DNA-binding CsgD family transcriptional regulator/tetratricopeptide (TPR) repeat protein
MTHGSSQPFDQPILCPVLVGRASVVDRLKTLTDAAHAGDGALALIAGEAGLGKSRLVSEVRQYAAARGFEVLPSACFPQDRNCAYAPLVDLLRARFAPCAAKAAASMAQPFARELAPLLPELLSAPSQAAPPLDEEQERRRLYAAFLHCLSAGAPDQPVLTIVEDLHWCDAASLDVLLQLVRRISGQRYLLLCSYRTEETPTELRRWLGFLDRERLSQELTLTPLSRAEVGAMLAVIFRETEPVPASLVDQLHGLADGNPFYVEELLSSVVASGELRRQGAGWRWEGGRDGELRLPRSLNEAVQPRVAQLSPAARELLTLAAVIGRRFDFDLLQLLTDADEPALLGLIKELIASQLVIEAAPDQFEFRHALTRRAIYSELLARERIGLHRAVAEAAERVYTGTLEQRLDDLAFHFSEGQAWERALDYARRAGERAQRLYAPRPAAEQYSRALIAAQQLARAPGLPPAVAPAALAALHRSRGRAYETLGEFQPALADYLRAVELASGAGDRQVEWQGLVDLGLLWAGRDYQQAGVYFQRALDLARGLGESTLIAHSLNRVGNWMVNTAQPREALPLHQEARSIFESVGDLPGLAATLDLLGMANYLCADLQGGLECYEHAAELFRSLDDRPGLTTALAMLSLRGGGYELGSMTADASILEQGVREGEQAIELARTIGWRAGESFALGTLSSVFGLRGEYRRALDLAQAALWVAQEIEHRQWIASAHSNLGLIYWDLLAVSAARPHLEQSLARARELGSTFWVQFTTGCLACVYVLGREFGRAGNLLADLPSPEQPVLSLGERWISFAHGQLALAQNDPARALLFLDRVNAPPLDGGVRRDTPRPAMSRGEALTALGRLAEAEALLERVHQVVRAQGVRPQIWRSHAALGNLYRAQNRTEDAQREYGRARSVIEGLAAEVRDPAIRDEFLQHATARLPRPYRLSPRRVESARFGGLTAREREVVVLIAQGKSNREIAEALVLGERTVETHVSNVLGKLGAASRREVAAWAAQHGLRTDPA